jgi:tRNA nucleotidyltransferase/poly(A) polymerase
MTIKTYQVGGYVRDKLLGVQSKDIDYAVEAPSYEAMVAWINERGKIFLEKPEFLTVRAHLHDGEPADYVLCRKDGAYSDGRRPDIVEPGSLFDDLRRRDFTVNAIAFDEETQQYIDPHGGMYDLETRELRCVGRAKDRFTEDALRMLRAIRFSITKDITMSGDIVDSFYDKELLALLRDKISTDRKRDELEKCFRFDTSKTIKTLMYLGMETTLLRDIFKAPSGTIWLLPTSKET